MEKVSILGAKIENQLVVVKSQKAPQGWSCSTDICLNNEKFDISINGIEAFIEQRGNTAPQFKSHSWEENFGLDLTEEGWKQVLGLCSEAMGLKPNVIGTEPIAFGTSGTIVFQIDGITIDQNGKKVL